MGRHKQLSDDALLAIAKAAFVAHGATLSTRELAAAAGVSEGVIYQRFGSKEALFLAALTPPILDMHALFRLDADENVRTHLQRLSRDLLAYFRQLVAVLLPLMTAPGFDFEAFARSHPESPIHQLRQRLTLHLRVLAERGAIGPVDSESAALTLFATLHSLATFERLGAHQGAFDAMTIDRIVETLWTGLRPAA